MLNTFLHNYSKANSKEKEFPNKKSGVYSISYKDCDKVYIGQTKRNLDTHMKEHTRNFRYISCCNSCLGRWSQDRRSKITQTFSKFVWINRLGKTVYTEVQMNSHEFWNSIRENIIFKYIKPTTMKDTKKKNTSKV